MTTLPMVLLGRSRFAFRPGRRRVVTPDVEVSPLTSMIELALRRPTSDHRAWTDRTTFKTHLVLQCDDYVHRVTGQVSGGVRRDSRTGQEAQTYRLSFGPQTFKPEREDDAVQIDGLPYLRQLRAGEGHRYRRAWLELEQVSGDDVDLELLALRAWSAPGNLELVHHSVAFQGGGAPAGESFGDGILAFSYAAAGSDRWLMVHASYHGTASSITFTNTDSEMWDSVGTPGTEPFGHACASKVAPSTGSTSYQATVASGEPQQLFVRVEQYVGVHQTTPTSSLSTEQSGTASPTSASPTATPDADDMVVDCAILMGDGFGAVGANQTDRNSTIADTQVMGHGSDRAGSFGGGAMTRATTGSNYGWLARAFIVETAAGGGTAIPVPAGGLAATGTAAVPDRGIWPPVGVAALTGQAATLAIQMANDARLLIRKA